MRTIKCVEETENGIQTLLDHRECPAQIRPNEMESCAMPACVGKNKELVHHTCYTWSVLRYKMIFFQHKITTIIHEMEM